ncbi:nickel ABC transporter substrate-binding protein [Aggregatibacter actinomycetemcomitans]|uniref:nickel ABC transporter substrate-binding protein n=1 Tax=Aggregatibacter actinomycetemcomitans TaxID=714 RepID=UPI0011DC93CA|nr:nickel ABC transporter substrate-binding protein [Aggregatibacter actinomycetemcomitans]QEH48666.1 nickel ABC transporter, nickel/metallophore periplasmic binding protein [Aggregatibacter actinomycetemcomitans]
MKKITLILTALFTALPSWANMQNNELDYASTKDIRDINPHLYSGEMAAQNMVFEPLVLNTEFGPQPYLAKSWSISPDGKTYIFKLRKDVKFSDGEPFNAQAVKLNIDAVLDNYTRHAWLELVQQIDSVRVIDDYTIELKLKNAYYPTLTELSLTRPFRFISPKSFIDGKTKDGVKEYAGTGPWMLVAHEENQYAHFTVNPHYWGQKPQLNAVVWNVISDRQAMLAALENGDIQLIFGSDGDMVNMDAFDKLKSSKTLSTLLSEPTATRFIILNSGREITGELPVREALEHAVNKQGIAQTVFANSESVAQTLMSKNVPYSDVEVKTFDYDIAKARQLLDFAGWKLPAGKSVREKQDKVLSLLFSYNADNAAEKEIAELIQTDLKNIGVDLRIVGEEKTAYLERQKTGDFDVQYSLSWGKPYEPASYISSFRSPAHADYQAQKGLKNKPEINLIIGELLITPDETLRKKLYVNLWRTLADQAVYLPLTYARTKAVFANELKGVGFNQSQYEIPFERMYFSSAQAPVTK